jgi:hypothetical protein
MIESKKSSDRLPVLYWALVLLLIILAAIAEELSAQELAEEPAAEEPAADLGLLLAQTCVAEIGFQRGAGECLIMWEINARNASIRGRSLEAQTLKFNAIWRVPRQMLRRPWIRDLDRTDQAPASWPKRWRWASFSASWIEYLEASDRFLELWGAGRWRFVCSSARDYGSPGSDRPAAECAQPVICHPRQRQQYWSFAKCAGGLK